jgi:dTDP-4-dehydrorhamnose 3,5-epimerase
MDQDWALTDMVPRGQSVTSDWEIVDQPAIEGVAVHEIRSVPTSYGHLSEVWRADWGFDGEGVGQVFASSIEPGAVTAWHAHAATIDRLSVVTGQLLIVLYDGRRSSATYGAINEWRTGAVRRSLLVVPPGVWHGVKNEGAQPAVLLNAVDRAYSYDGPDHWSVASDSPSIPYDLS